MNRASWCRTGCVRRPFYRSSSYGLRAGVLTTEHEPARFVLIPYVLFDTRGIKADTIGWYSRGVPKPITIEVIAVNDLRYGMPEVRDDEPLWLYSETGWILLERRRADSGNVGFFSLTWIDFSGNVLRKRWYSYAPLPYSRKQVDRFVRAVMANPGKAVIVPYAITLVPQSKGTTESERSRAEKLIRDALQIPRHQPPVASFHIGSDGWIWLEREDLEPETSRWLILQQNGEPIGNVSVPASWRIL